MTTTASTQLQTTYRPIAGTLLALLIVGLGLRASFLLWHPPFDADLYDYDTIAPIRDDWFAMHFFAGAPGVLLAFGSFGMLAVLIVGGGRVGRLLAIVGTLIASMGAMLFAFGLAAEGAAWSWATNPDVIDPAAGAALLRGIEGEPLTPLILLGSSILIPLGVLIVLAALLVSRRVPRWLIIATVVILLASALIPPLPVVAGVQVVIQSIALIAIGWFAVRPRTDR